MLDATNRVLRLSPVSVFEAGSYTVEVINDVNTATSDAAVLVVNRLPIAGADFIATPQDGPVSIPLSKLLFNDSDPDADPIAITAAGPGTAQNGRVSLAGGLVTYGIVPRAASTAYGHIQQGEALPTVDGVAVHRVRRFVEKPDRATAERYTTSGEYRWNSGMFTWRADVVLAELGRHCGWLTEALRPVRGAWGTPGFEAALAAAYGPLKKISIDYALMEHATDVKVVSAAFDWDDVGSWDAVLDNLPRDGAGVATRGQALTLDCRDCLAISEGGPLVALAGLEGVIAVATADAVLVCPRGGSQQVKQVVEALKTAKRNDLL